MKIVVRRKVEKELPKIFKYNLENESESRAIKIIDSITQAINKIGKNPFPFPKNPKYSHLQVDTRKYVVHKTYIITFRIFKNHVAIIDLYHGRRKI